MALPESCFTSLVGFAHLAAVHEVQCSADGADRDALGSAVSAISDRLRDDGQRAALTLSPRIRGDLLQSLLGDLLAVQLASVGASEEDSAAQVDIQTFADALTSSPVTLVMRDSVLVNALHCDCTAGIRMDDAAFCDNAVAVYSAVLDSGQFAVPSIAWLRLPSNVMRAVWLDVPHLTLARVTRSLALAAAVGGRTDDDLMDARRLTTALSTPIAASPAEWESTVASLLASSAVAAGSALLLTTIAGCVRELCSPSSFTVTGNGTLSLWQDDGDDAVVADADGAPVAAAVESVLAELVPQTGPLRMSHRTWAAALLANAVAVLPQSAVCAALVPSLLAAFVPADDEWRSALPVIVPDVSRLEPHARRHAQAVLGHPVVVAHLFRVAMVEASRMEATPEAFAALVAPSATAPLRGAFRSAIEAVGFAVCSAFDEPLVASLDDSVLRVLGIVLIRAAHGHPMAASSAPGTLRLALKPRHETAPLLWAVSALSGRENDAALDVLGAFAVLSCCCDERHSRWIFAGTSAAPAVLPSLLATHCPEALRRLVAVSAEEVVGAEALQRLRLATLVQP